MASDTVLFEVDDGVATITLNRPEQLNALNRELTAAFMDALRTVRDDDAIRVAIVTGAGRAFCAGADLKERAASDSAGGDNFFAGTPGEGFYTFTLMKPLITAVHGFCLAGGLELALTCDLRIAAEGTRFGMPEITRGFFPGGGGPQRLPRMMPQAIAMEMLLTGDHYEAEQMLQWGLVNRVVPRDELLDSAMQLARRIAEHAPLAVRAVKELAYAAEDMTLQQAMRHGAGLRWIIGQTDDAKEGPRAFAEKRSPKYEGR